MDFDELPYGKSAIFSNEQYRNLIGDFYTATHLATDVTDTNSVEILFESGSKICEFTAKVKATGQCTIEYVSEPTFTDKGTEITPVNRNDTVDKTATAMVYHTPTIDTSGTVQTEDLIPGTGVGVNIVGGTTDTRQIIGKNKDYLLRITNTSGANIKIFAQLSWSEVEA